jgi:hypothetical protein
MGRILSHVISMLVAIVAAVGLASCAAPNSDGQESTMPEPIAEPIAVAEMGFFVTSAGLGDGANLGGLEGADAYCQQLAEAVGAGGRTWVAYLSTQGDDAVDASDRIGAGPWYNAEGALIAENVAALHQDDVNINLETSLDENGEMVPYVRRDEDGNAIPPPEQPEQVEHDILTGTQADGMGFGAGEDMTCNNWTSNSEDGTAMVGHSDRRSLQPGVSPWSAAHPSQGCSQQNLINTGGAGRLYCFARD